MTVSCDALAIHMNTVNVAHKFHETALFRFRKVVIELWMHCDPDGQHKHSDEVVNMCV